jgi:hypothetical protein
VIRSWTPRRAHTGGRSRSARSSGWGRCRGALESLEPGGRANGCRTQLLNGRRARQRAASCELRANLLSETLLTLCCKRVLLCGARKQRRHCRAESCDATETVAAAAAAAANDNAAAAAAANFTARGRCRRPCINRKEAGKALCASAALRCFAELRQGFFRGAEVASHTRQVRGLGLAHNGRLELAALPAQ